MEGSCKILEEKTESEKQVKNQGQHNFLWN